MGRGEWGGAGGAEPWHRKASEDLAVGNCNSDLDKFDPWEEGAQSPRERVGEAEGIRSEAQVPEGGVGMAREGSSGQALAALEAAVWGALPHAAPVLESHQPRAALPRGSPAWEGPTPLSGSRPPCPVRGPSLGLSGFSLRLGATRPTSPSSGG